MDRARAGKALTRLEHWLRDRGWELRTKPRCRDEADFDDKYVLISRHNSPEHQIFSLLHECGHIVAGGRKAIVEQVFASNRTKKTDTHRVRCVVNEVRAWDAGEKLAKRLGISVSRASYMQYQARYLKKYMRWAVTGSAKAPKANK